MTNRWVVGSRPRTLPAAVVPVALGTGAAWQAGDVVWWRVALALVVSLALQVGVNFANDYSDGIRGTDDVRVGPVRLVASGLAAPGAVKRAAFAAFGVAAAAGLALAVATTWWLLAVGAAAIAAAWFYTGGSHPYGYAGFGELFVFVFFGLVATAGTTYVAVEQITGLAIVMGVAAGCLSCALLVVNNLRDIPTDTVAGKRTLAVRLGGGATRVLFVALVLGAFVVAVVAALTWHQPLIGTLLSFGVAIPPLRTVRRGAKGPALIPVLAGTGRLQIVYGAIACFCLFLER